MAIIKSFKALRYNERKIKNLSKVVSPPYDIISAKMQEKLYKTNPFNFVRLDLGKIYPTDTEESNRYIRASHTLEEWIRKEILVRDSSDSIYIYIQQFIHNGKILNRIGFLALFKLEDSEKSKILPHENTFAKPKLDRLKLTKSVGGNLSPIFSIFDDSKKTVLNSLKKAVKNKKPALDINFDNCRHKIYRIDNKNFINNLKKAISPKNIYIADGHHRYEVALNFKKEMIEKGQYKPEYDFVLMYFAPIEQEGNVVLATHRTLKNPTFKNYKVILDKLSSYFSITKFSNQKVLLDMLEKKTENKHKIGMYFGKNLYYLLVLKNEEDIDRLIEAKKSSDWKRLGVSILHELVFKKILNINPSDDDIVYARDPHEASKLVKTGKSRLAFFLRPTEIKEIRKIANLGEKMPHKATYFYPKLLSGLIINKF